MVKYIIQIVYNVVLTFTKVLLLQSAIEDVKQTIAHAPPTNLNITNK